MRLTANEYQTLLRQDFYTFIERCFYALNPTTPFMRNWHIEVIAAELEKFRTGETKRLIINVPPRSLKSLCASIALPAWLLGHDPSSQIICASYAQDLANKLASDCRSILTSDWYKGLFPTRLGSSRPAVEELVTTKNGFRLATSVGGVLTGRGSDCIIIDDPVKPDEALSDSQRKAVNDWFDNTLCSRLNSKRDGRIAIIMQRLHEDDLVGHVLGQEPWKILRFPAIAEEDEEHIVETLLGRQSFRRRMGEPLHIGREPLEVLQRMRETMGEYHFAAQYQQNPAPLGGGMVKIDWFQHYVPSELPLPFDMKFQSWDTANKPGELNDHSVCTTWGVKDKNLYLLHVLRKRLGYPELKRAVREQAEAHSPGTILIEDKASGTQLIQDLIADGVHEVKRYESTMDKIMRMHSVTSTIENGFVYVPEKAPWLAEYLHELATFPKGKYDDQVDSTSQALDWFKQQNSLENGWVLAGAREHAKQKKREAVQRETSFPVLPKLPESMRPRKAVTEQCTHCGSKDLKRWDDNWTCNKCGKTGKEGWIIPGINE
jgi:predicted phage terminase large subunit-like protein